MSKTYLFLAALMGGTVAIHVFLGGPQYSDAFVAKLPNADLIAMSQVLWHAVTVSLILFALGYAYLAFAKNTGLAVFLNVQQLGWAVLFLAYGYVYLGEVWTQPQWILFLGFPLGSRLAEALRHRSQL